MLTDLAQVRSRLTQKLGPEVFDWLSDARDAVLKNLAESEYNLHCAERVRNKITAMNADDAKHYLVDLVMNSLDVGLAILSEE